MELTDLINSIQAIQVVGNVQRKDVSGIFIDSRKVIPHSIYVAISGLKVDGHSYIMESLNRGAYVIICEKDVVPLEIFNHSNAVRILVKDSRKALAQVSKAYYNSAIDSLSAIGVTGTNGKTTTTYYIKEVLQKNNSSVGLIGTIANYVNDRELKTDLTTPDAHELHSLFANMKNEGCKYVVMEVSSHSLDMKRVDGIRYNAAVFTNLTSEHLDYHKSFDNYLNAKKMLFDNLDEKSYAVVNCDDVNYKKIIADCKGKVVKYGKSEEANYRIQDIKVSLDGTEFLISVFNNKPSIEARHSMHSNSSVYKIKTKLIGEFNAYNSAAAFVLCYEMGIDINLILDTLANMNCVPGRFEVIKVSNRYAIVDYSHTSDSLEKALMNLRNVVSNKKIITVFGCGGDRDAAKRPIMGRIATELSDEAIITNDNPRNEAPMQIVEEIIKGIEKNNYRVIIDRREAIKKAVEMMKDDSIVLIAGKGHEDYQIINGKRLHFSDKDVAIQLMEEIYNRETL